MSFHLTQWLAGKKSILAIAADCCVRLLIDLRYLLLVILLGSISATVVYAKGIEVKQVSSTLMNDVYWLNAQIDYQPSEAVLEALEHGVALTFQVRIEVRRKGEWPWERKVVGHKLRYTLRYHALASMYELFQPGRKRPQRFATRNGALRALGELSDIELVAVKKLNADETYLIKLQAKLDIESLPVPLRPRAYLSSQWTLTSEKHSWPLKR